MRCPKWLKALPLLLVSGCLSIVLLPGCTTTIKIKPTAIPIVSIDIAGQTASINAQDIDLSFALKSPWGQEDEPQ